MISKSSKFSQVFAASVVISIIYWPQPTASQTIVGNRSSPPVTVDLSVLEHIGVTPTVPQLMQRSLRPLLMPNSRLHANVPLPPQSSPQLSPPSAISGSLFKKPLKQANKIAKPAKPKIAKIPPPKAKRALPPSPKVPPPPPKIATAPRGSAPLSLTRSRPPKKLAALPKQDAGLITQGDTNYMLKEGQQFRFNFASGSSKISESVETQLNGIADSLIKNGKLRLQLLAYAGGGGQTLSQARRTSLSRGLTIRAQLIDKGVRSTRIDVRALGNKSDDGPPDRVDMIITSR